MSRAAEVYEYGRRRTESLTPYARNARTHSEAQIAQIAASVEEFGFTNPVLIDEGGGIIAGHGRVLAAQQIGIAEVPVVILAGLSEAQRRAYVLADNKLALNAGWDEELLAAELDELRDLEFDLPVLGFEPSELNHLIGTPNTPSAEWRGMPEFNQKDKTAFKSIAVHFKDQAAVDRFAELIGQKITEHTRFAWFPEIEIETYADKEYADR